MAKAGDSCNTRDQTNDFFDDQEVIDAMLSLPLTIRSCPLPQEAALAVRKKRLNRRAFTHRGRKSTFRDSISVPQLVFLPSMAITGRAAIFSPRWMMKAS